MVEIAQDSSGKHIPLMAPNSGGGFVVSLTDSASAAVTIPVTSREIAIIEVYSSADAYISLLASATGSIDHTTGNFDYFIPALGARQMAVPATRPYLRGILVSGSGTMVVSQLGAQLI